MHRRSKTFQVNQIVFLIDRVVKANNSVLMAKTGPYQVVSLAPNQHTAYIKALDQANSRIRKVHYSHLRPLKELPMVPDSMTMPMHFDSEITSLGRQFNRDTDSDPFNNDTNTNITGSPEY